MKYLLALNSPIQLKKAVYRKRGAELDASLYSQLITFILLLPRKILIQTTDCVQRALVVVLNSPAFKQLWIYTYPGQPPLSR